MFAVFVADIETIILPVDPVIDVVKLTPVVDE